MKQFIDNKDWLYHTDVCCWWCCHEFQTVPLGLPLKYKDNKYLIKGVFCTFGCMLAYDEIYNLSSKYLINQLYKDLTGISIISSTQNYLSFLKQNLDMKYYVFFE